MELFFLGIFEVCVGRQRLGAARLRMLCSGTQGNAAPYLVR